MESQAIKILSASDCAGAVNEEAVLSAESRLGVRFPMELREFFKSYGAVSGLGIDIAGIVGVNGSSPPMWRDVVVETERFRLATKNRLPSSLVLVSDDGASVKYFVDTALSETVCRITAFGPGSDGVIVAESLSEFIVKRNNDEI
ncbi:MAG: SMI1/KNR4 family protein [Planctomycetota bacterium]|jgi:hypothetical protein